MKGNLHGHMAPATAPIFRFCYRYSIASGRASVSAVSMPSQVTASNFPPPFNDHLILLHVDDAPAIIGDTAASSVVSLLAASRLRPAGSRRHTAVNASPTIDKTKVMRSVP